MFLDKIAFEDRVILRYGRLSTVEQKPIAKERQVFSLNQTAKKLGPLTEDTLFFDLESGGKNDRRHYLEMLKIVEAKECHAVVIPKVERLSRDLGELMRLWTLFQSSGVGLFINEWDGFVNFKKRSLDRDKFIGEASEADKERMRIGRRTAEGHEWNRHKRKASYKVPFGYYRSKEGQYIKSEKTEAIALEIVARFFGESYPQYHSFRGICDWLKDAHGLSWQPRRLSKWLLYPATAGHTAYFTGELYANTHEGYVSDEQQAEVRAVIEQNKVTRGCATPAWPLSRVSFCGYCGCKMTSRRIERGDKIYHYLRCSGAHSMSLKSPCYKENYTTVKYAEIEADLIQKIAERSQQIALSAIENEVDDPETKDPRVLAIENKINKIKAAIRSIGDDDGALESRIIGLEAEKNSLSMEPEAVNDEHLELMQAFSSYPENWEEFFSVDERRDAYPLLVKSIVVWTLEKRWEITLRV